MSSVLEIISIEELYLRKVNLLKHLKKVEDEILKRESINEKILTDSTMCGRRSREIAGDLSDANFPESGGACDVGFQPSDVQLTSPAPGCHQGWTQETRVEEVQMSPITNKAKNIKVIFNRSKETKESISPVQLKLIKKITITINDEISTKEEIIEQCSVDTKTNLSPKKIRVKLKKDLKNII